VVASLLSLPSLSLLSSVLLLLLLLLVGAFAEVCLGTVVESCVAFVVSLVSVSDPVVSDVGIDVLVVASGASVVAFAFSVVAAAFVAAAVVVASVTAAVVAAVDVVPLDDVV